jgi:DNA invertase Pin-like site-specific DNA recombinase
MRAFGYVRISKLDADTTSPQRQREAIERLCADRGWELVRVFEDLDLSAYRRDVKRPGFEAMMARLGEIDRIVFWRLDRLARSVATFSRALEACREAAVELVSTDHQIDTGSAMGRAFVQITATFAELESGTLSERARQMHAHLRAKGQPVGRVPFGWRRNGKGLEPVPEQQAVLVEAARRYVAGESLRSIAAGVGIHHPNLAQRLRSDRVIEALPPELGARLVETLAERGRTGTRAKQSLLGGIARCAVCGAGLTIVGQRMGNGDRKAWGAYACREKGHVTISRGWLDDHITAEVVAAIDTGKLVERLAKRKRTRRTRPVSEIEARLELLERDFYERGMLSRDSFLRRREGLLRRLAEARASEENAGIDLPRELAMNLGAAWPTLSMHGRRRIISAVIARVEVSKASNHGRIDPSRVRLAWRE